MLKNFFSVLIGNLSLVSYCELPGIDNSMLPKIRKGIWSPASIIKKTELTISLAQRLNVMYAKDYRMIQDLNIIIKSWKNSQ